MLIHYKSRFSILFKSITSILVCLFIINDISWAQELSSLRGRETAEAISKKTLAVPSSILDPQFKEKVALAEINFSAEGVMRFIDEQLQQERDVAFKGKAGEWKEHRIEVIEDLASPLVRGRIKGNVVGLKSVVFVRLAGLLASTRQFAYVDLTGETTVSKEYGGLPVVYIDSMLCNTSDRCVQRHEVDEILQWEYFRINVLRLSSKEEMGDWIRKQIDSPDEKLKGTDYEGLNSRQIAELLHGYSYPLRTLDSKIIGTTDFAYGYIAEMLRMYPAFKTTRVNIAAKSEDEERIEPSLKGKGKRGVSKHVLLKLFKRSLNEVSAETIAKLRHTHNLGECKTILMDANVAHASQIDGKYIITAIENLLRNAPVSKNIQQLENRLRYGGHGRFLTAYLDDNFDYVIKTYLDPNKKREVKIKWIEEGWSAANERLNGLAARTLIIDATEGKAKEFTYFLEGTGSTKTDIAIIQEKIVPLMHHLKQLIRSEKNDEAKKLIDAFKEAVIMMFRRGVVDVDFGGMLANYGFNERTGKVCIFDFGDLTTGTAKAYEFTDYIDVTNEYTEDGLRTEVDDLLAEYFKSNPFKEKDFYDADGKYLFGVDLTPDNMPAFKMSFPYTEEQVRRIFAGDVVHGVKEEQKVVGQRIAREGETPKKGPLEQGGGTRVFFKQPPESMGEMSDEWDGQGGSQKIRRHRPSKRRDYDEGSAPAKKSASWHNVKITNVRIPEIEKEIIAGPDVYASPVGLTTFMADAIGDDLYGQQCLDLGTGTGALGFIMLKRNAAAVVFADIKSQALNNARQNAARLGYAPGKDPRAEFVYSDLFSELSDRKFNLILFTPSPMDGWDISANENQRYRYREHVELFFKDAGSHLDASSRILFRDTVFPEDPKSVGRADQIERMVRAFGEREGCVVEKRGPHRRFVESVAWRKKGKGAVLRVPEETYIYVITKNVASESEAEKIVAPRPAREGETPEKGPLEPGSGTRVNFKSDPDELGEPPRRAAPPPTAADSGAFIEYEIKTEIAATSYARGRVFYNITPVHEVSYIDILDYLESHPNDKYMLKYLAHKYEEYGDAFIDEVLSRVIKKPTPVLLGIFMSIDFSKYPQALKTLDEVAKKYGGQKILAMLEECPLLSTRQKLDDFRRKREAEFIKLFESNRESHIPLASLAATIGIPILPEEQAKVADELRRRYTSLKDIPTEPEDAEESVYHTGTGLRARKPAETLEQITPIALSIIDASIPNPIAIDGVGAFVVVPWRINATVSSGRNRYKLTGLNGSSGKGLYMTSAMSSGLMEAIERYSAEIGLTDNWPSGYEEDLRMIYGKASDLREKGLNLLDINKVNLLYPYKDQPLYWVSGKIVTERGNEAIYVPAQMVFLLPNFDEPEIMGDSTNGLASGNVMNEARLHALLELFERDSDYSMFYAPERVFRIETQEKILASALKNLQDFGVDVQFLDLTSEFGVPTYRAFVKLGDTVLSGSGAHLDGRIALWRALYELIPKILHNPDIKKLRQQQQPGGKMPVLKFEELPNYSVSINADLHKLERLLDANGYSPIYIDLTRADWKIPVVRAIVPGFAFNDGLTIRGLTHLIRDLKGDLRIVEGMKGIGGDITAITQPPAAEGADKIEKFRTWAREGVTMLTNLEAGLKELVTCPAEQKHKKCEDILGYFSNIEYASNSILDVGLEDNERQAVMHEWRRELRDMDGFESTIRAITDEEVSMLSDRSINEIIYRISRIRGLMERFASLKRIVYKGDAVRNWLTVDFEASMKDAEGDRGKGSPADNGPAASTVAQDSGAVRNKPSVETFEESAPLGGISKEEIGMIMHELKGFANIISLYWLNLPDNVLNKQSLNELDGIFQELRESTNDMDINDLLLRLHSQFSEEYIRSIEERVRNEVSPTSGDEQEVLAIEKILKVISLSMKVMRLYSGYHVGKETRDKRDVKLNDILTCYPAVKKGLIETVTFDLRAGDISIHTDEIALFQVMRNLLRNAVEATAKRRKNKITVRTYLGDDKKSVFIQVEDQGTGISSENLSKIFTTGFTTKDYGKGLGLAIVKDLIETHCGGIIDVQSKFGKGTIFTIQLPITQPPATGLPAAQDVEIASAASRPRNDVTDEPDESNQVRNGRLDKPQPPAAGGSSATQELTTQNTPDIENLLRILSDMIPVKSKQDDMKYYRIRYDATRIPNKSPAEDLLKLYCERVLPMYMRGKDRVKLVASDGKGQSLISVECFNDKGMTNRVGQGRVDVKEGNALRLIGMLNMAFLASQIPDNTPPDEIKSQYSELISIIEKQCKEMMADAKPLSDVIEYTANGIWIKLPHAAQVPIDKIDEYYRLTITQLEQSA